MAIGINIILQNQVILIFGNSQCRKQVATLKSTFKLKSGVFRAFRDVVRTWRHFNLFNDSLCLHLDKVFLLTLNIVIIDHLLDIYEICCNLTHRRCQIWVIDQVLLMFIHLGNIFTPITTVNHCIGFKHSSHIWLQLRSVFADLQDISVSRILRRLWQL